MNAWTRRTLGKRRKCSTPCAGFSSRGMLPGHRFSNLKNFEKIYQKKSCYLLFKSRLRFSRRPLPPLTAIGLLLGASEGWSLRGLPLEPYFIACQHSRCLPQWADSFTPSDVLVCPPTTVGRTYRPATPALSPTLSFIFGPPLPPPPPTVTSVATDGRCRRQPPQRHPRGSSSENHSKCRDRSLSAPPGRGTR